MGEPTGTAGDHTSALERAIDQVREGIKNMVDKFNAGVDHINDKWFWMPVPAKLWIRRSLDKAREALDRILVIARETLAHYTPVISLINISFHWLDQVKKPVSNMVSPVSGWANANLAYWEGGAAKHYNLQVIPDQKDATDALSQKAGFISEWLYDIAMANVQFVTKLFDVVGTILGQITTAAIEAASLVDIPFAIATLSEAIGSLVETGVNALTSIAERVVEAGGRARSAVSDRVDESKFPGGSWPQAVKG